MRILEAIGFAAACFYLFDLGRFVVTNWTHIVAYYR